MLKNGFLRFCDNPEIACCKAERELEQLRVENASLHTAEMWKSIEAACIAYQKERTLEHADQLVRAVEGKL